MANEKTMSWGAAHDALTEKLIAVKVGDPSYMDAKGNYTGRGYTLLRDNNPHSKDKGQLKIAMRNALGNTFISSAPSPTINTKWILVPLAQFLKDAEAQKAAKLALLEEQRLARIAAVQKQQELKKSVAGKAAMDAIKKSKGKNK